MTDLAEELQNFINQINENEGLVFPKDIPIPNHLLDPSTVTLFTEKFPLDLLRLFKNEIPWWNEEQYDFTYNIIYSIITRVSEHKQKWLPADSYALRDPYTYHPNLNQSNPYGFSLINWYAAFFKWLDPICRLDKEENRVLCKTAYLNALKMCWLSLPNLDMPAIFIDEEIVEKILNQHPLDITSLPLADMNFNIAYNAIRSVLSLIATSNDYNLSWYWHIFIDCPITLKDTSLCREAYALNKALALYMPEDQVTYEMVEELSVLSHNPGHISNSLDRIPLKHRDFQICQNYVKIISGINIRHVPDSVITQELCDLAFENNANSFSYIPTKFRTYAMCLAATKKVNVTIAWLEIVECTPIEYQTDEFWDSFHIRNERFCVNCNNCRCKQCTKEL
jgi:hypothetical protein